MSYLKHNSWGRTRSPKNIAGPPGTAVTLETAPTTSATAGYATENQRYLHVLCEDNNGGSPGTVSVYGYNHAFGRWFELPQSFSQVGTNAAPTAATIVAPADTGHAEYAPATITAAEREFRTYEILGIDRVAFVGSTAHTNVYAACSTF